MPTETGTKGEPRQKGVAIDGANFSRMLAALEVEHISFRRLSNLLQHTIGSSRSFVQRPRYVLPPDLCVSGREVHDSLKRAGFLPRACTSVMEADDLVVSRWGCRYIAKATVTDIIVVSCDHEIIDAVLRLGIIRFKNGSPDFQIHFFGTHAESSHGHPMIGSQALRNIKTCGAFARFYDIADFTDRIRSD